MRYEPRRSLLQDRLDSGRYRARDLGLPWERILPFDLAQQLNLRRTEDGILRCYADGVPLEDDRSWHLDHVDPLALGGPHLLWNLEPLCVKCNLRKGKRPISDAAWKRLLDGREPHVLFRDRPVEEMWALSRRAARQFAWRPRDVAVVDWGKAHSERAIVAALLAAAGDWTAVPLQQIQGMDTSGGQVPRGGALLSNYWTRLMGLPHDATIAHGWLPDDRRYRPSLWFAPTWAADPTDETLKVEAFRLRNRVSLDLARAYAEGQTVQPVPTQGAPDRDEDPLPRNWPPTAEDRPVNQLPLERSADEHRE